LFDELLLSAVAEGGEDQPAADEVGDLRPVVEADDVQCQVQRRRTAGGRQDVAVIDEQDVRMKVHLRVTAPEVVGQLPVHRRRAPVKQACLSQRVGTGAQANQPRAALVGALQGLDDSRMRGRVGIRPVRHEDGVRVIDVAEVAGSPDGEHRVPYGHAPSGGHHPEPVELTTDLRAPPGTENLARASQLEGIGTLVDDQDDRLRVVVGILRHVAFLALSAAAADRQDRSRGEDKSGR
jgi:hypothetical protein